MNGTAQSQRGSNGRRSGALAGKGLRTEASRSTGVHEAQGRRPGGHRVDVMEMLRSSRSSCWRVTHAA